MKILMKRKEKKLLKEKRKKKKLLLRLKRNGLRKNNFISMSYK